MSRGICNDAGTAWPSAWKRSRAGRSAMLCASSRRQSKKKALIGSPPANPSTFGLGPHRRTVRDAVRIESQAVEEKSLDRQLAAQLFDVEPAADATHRDLERTRSARCRSEEHTSE